MPDHTIRSYLTRSLAATIEARVSTYLDRDWRITIVVDKADDSSHPAALLSDGSERFFVKIYHGVLAFDQLKIEVAALRLLTEQAAVLTPTVIDLFPVEEAVLVIMAAVEAQPWQPADWQA
ncbi:MAG: hypothetical protein KDE47_34645, partial [Caldilineaceae bacterium]|nr:hypothetical protein [Caldilineaceae bacterium]